MNNHALHAPLRRSLAAPLAVLLLSGLLLFSWFGVLAAVPAPLESRTAALPAIAGLDIQAHPADLTAGLVPGIAANAAPAAIRLPGAAPSQAAAGAPVLAPTAPLFDLKISVSQPAAALKVGAGNIYVITVERTNTEIVDQTVAVVDSLPNGLTWTPYNFGKWDCTASTATLVSCFYNEANPAAIEVLQIQVNVPKTAPYTFTNTATLTTPDADASNNSSSIVSTVESLDLQLANAVTPASIVTGTVSYNLAVTNNGPVTATLVEIKDTFSPDLEYLGVDPATEAANFSVDLANSSASWKVGSLPKDATRQITIRFRTRASAAGKTLNNTAIATSSNIANDYEAANNNVSAPLQVGKAALQVPFDLRITKNQIPSTFKVGTGNIYVISVSRTNTGTIDQLVTVEDALPNGLTWTPANIGRWNCVTTSTTTLVSCFYSESNPSTFDQLQFQVTVPADITPTTFSNMAVLDLTDANAANNSSTITTIVDSLDLQIAKTVTPANIITGTVSYNLVLTNTGPVVGNAVFVEETFSSDLEFLGFEPAGENFVVTSATTGIWTLGDMPAETTRRITLNFRTRSTASGKVLNNTATVRYQNFNDYNTANNTASASLVVGGLVISKRVSPATAQVGEPITFTFVVTNTGTTAQQSITLRDALHPHLIFRRFSSRKGSSGSMNASTNTFSMNIFGGLAAQETETINLVVAGSTSISNTETLTNAATLSWVSAGTTLSIRSNEVQFTINPGGSIQVSKTDGQTTVNPGTTISYTVSITNTGNRTVNTIRITDTLVSYLTAVSVGGLGNIGTGSCPNTTTCVVTFNNPLATGTKATFWVAGRVSSNTPAGATVVNEVRATGTDDLGRSLSSTFTDVDTVLALPQFSMFITEAVVPRQGRVGDSFTFRIEVANNGTSTVSGVRVTAEFPAVLDLTSVTTSLGTGTLNTGARTVDVNLGSMAAGQEARITIIARVNNTATTIETYRTNALMTWTGGRLRSNDVRFRVLPGATLPGTGWAPRLAAGLPASAGSAAMAGELGRLLIGLVLLGGLGLAGLGMLLLAYSIYARARHPLHAGSYTRGGLALLVLGLFAGLAGIVMTGLLPVASEPDLVMLAGEKPPLASQPAAQPTRTRRPTATADIAQYLPTPTPQSLPDYPVPTPTIGVSEGPKGIEPDASEVTRIVVPSMGLDTEVRYVPFDGQTWMIGGLKQEIAWMGDTSWPGLGGNTGLAGHVDLASGDAGPFWNLSALKAGDQVVLYTQKHRYVYTVSENIVVSDADMHVLDQTTDPTITMITCAGWDAELEAYLQRLIVYARLAEVHTLGE